jgi:hypothetical protein
MSLPSIPILTDEGQIWLEIEDPAERSLVGSYWNAIDSYKAGDVEKIEAFSGVRIGGYLLVTDPDEIEYWADRGQTDFPEFYESDR